MFDLMKQGLDVQGAIVKANHDADVFRIVRGDETLHAVMLEAISKGAYVWANSAKRRTCINTSMPTGEGWTKVHGTYSMPAIQQFVESAGDDTSPDDAA